MVTSMEFDHGDIYRDLGEIETAFQRMLRQIPREGTLLLCADNHARSLASCAFSNVVSYGIDAAADWSGRISMTPAGAARLEVRHRDVLWGEVIPPLFGRHNIRTSSPPWPWRHTGHVGPGHRGRRTVFRRTTPHGSLSRYGRSSTWMFRPPSDSIRETIAAARLLADRRIRALFEPRSNTTVTNRFQTAMEDAFSAADEVFIGPVHRANAIPESQRLDTALLVRALREKGLSAHAFEDVGLLAEAVTNTGGNHDVVLIMSNGAFGGIYDLFKKQPF